MSSSSGVKMRHKSSINLDFSECPHLNLKNFIQERALDSIRAPEKYKKQLTPIISLANLNVGSFFPAPVEQGIEKLKEIIKNFNHEIAYSHDLKKAVELSKQTCQAIYEVDRFLEAKFVNLDKLYFRELVNIIVGCLHHRICEDFSHFKLDDTVHYEDLSQTLNNAPESFLRSFYSREESSSFPYDILTTDYSEKVALQVTIKAELLEAGFIASTKNKPYEAALYINFAEKIRKKGESFLLSGEGLVVKNLYLKVLDLNPNYSAEIYVYLADFLIANKESYIKLAGQRISPKELYQKAIELDANNNEIYYKLGSTLLSYEKIVLNNGQVVTKEWLMDKQREYLLK